MIRPHRFLICLIVSAAGFVGTAGAGVPIGGQVVGPGGRGLAGIRVGLEPIPREFERLEARLDGAVGPGPAVETTTDDDGFFELPAPSLGAWKVVVALGEDGEVEGAAPAYVAEEFLLSPLTEPTELPPVELQTASVVEFEVIDENARPADARLFLSDQRRRQDSWRSRQRLARTGEDGVARLALGAEEEPLLVAVGASRPTAVVVGEGFVAKDVRVGLRLSPGVAGIAVASDRGGRPVAGAVAYQFHSRCVVPLGRTDGEGRLRLAVAPERQPSGVVLVTRDGLQGHFEPRFSAGGTNEAVVLLEPIATVRGEVVDIESRKPVGGALVWVPGGPVAEADARGRYELRFVPSPWLTVGAVSYGYAMAYERRRLDGAEPEGGPTIALAPAAAVSGSVVDTEGNPLAEVDVSVRSAANGELFGSSVLRGPSIARSWRRGQFFLTGLPPSASFELLFSKDGFAPARQEIAGLDAFEVRYGIKVVLGAGASGVGRVVDGAEAPVADAEVRLVRVESGDSRKAIHRFRWDLEDEVARSLTDAEGLFRFTHLADGRYNLAVKAAGFSPFTVAGLAVEGGPDEQDFGTVVLVAGTRLEGVVRDPQGFPVADALVQAGPQDSLVYVRRSDVVAQSDASGRFVVADLENGKPFVVTVSKQGYSPATTSVVAKAGESLEILLRPAGTISGRVANEDSEPVGNATVVVDPREMTRRYIARHAPAPATTDEEGSFRIEGVHPGIVQLAVRAEGYQAYQVRDLDVPSGGALGHLEVVLVRGATIVGTVTRSDGTPVVGATVAHAPASESSRILGSGKPATGETDVGGRYRIEGVPPGPAVVQALKGDHHPRASKNVEIGSGTQTIDLTFDEGFVVSGRVREAAGAPVAGASLVLIATDPSRSRFSSRQTPKATTAADGGFTLEDVTASHYLLSATREGFAPATTLEPFEVADGPVTGIELVLARGATLRGRIFGLEADELATVTVQASSDSAMAVPSLGVVDFEGRYSVPDLGPGMWRVLALMETSGRRASGRVTLDEGQAEATLDLEFKTGYDVQGVLRTAGQPPSGIRVVASGLEVGLGIAQVVSDGEGRFRFAQLPAGSFRLVAYTEMAQHSRVIEIPADGEVVFELSVQRITGHVRDETGERPLPGVAVRIEGLETGSDAYSRSSTETDSRGYFSLGANEGAHRLIATKAGYGASETTVDVRAGGRHEGIELRLVPTDGVSFDLLPESGTQPTRVMTAVADLSGRVLTKGYVQVGEGGTVRLSTVPAGTWELAVQAGDSAVVRTTVTAPGHSGPIRLPRGGGLRIEVPELAGPQPGPSRAQLAEVRLVGPDGRPYFRLEDTFGGPPRWTLWNGVATVTQLLPGVWTFTVSHPDGRIWTGEAVVSAGEVSEVSASRRDF